MAVKTIPTSPPQFVSTYPAVATSVSAVRQRVQRALQEWLMESILDDALLVVSELATNAVRHCGGDSFSVLVLHQEGGVRIQVTDTCTTIPTLPTVSDDAEGGRGMFLVGALAHNWGIELDKGRKTVWAELR